MARLGRLRLSKKLPRKFDCSALWRALLLEYWFMFPSGTFRRAVRGRRKPSSLLDICRGRRGEIALFEAAKSNHENGLFKASNGR